MLFTMVNGVWKDGRTQIAMIKELFSWDTLLGHKHQRSLLCSGDVVGSGTVWEDTVGTTALLRVRVAQPDLLRWRCGSERLKGQG